MTYEEFDELPLGTKFTIDQKDYVLVEDLRREHVLLDTETWKLVQPSWVLVFD